MTYPYRETDVIYPAVRPDGHETPQVFDPARLVAIARRQLRPVIACCILGLVLGVAYLLTAVPLYTAETNVIIDASQLQAGQDQTLLNSTGLMDTDTVDSQVEVLKSEKIALAVMQNLKLDRDPQFLSESATLLSTVRGWLNPSHWLSAPPLSAADAAFRKQRDTLDALGDNLTVARVAHTYVIAVSYRSASPARASQVANAFAEAYLTDQLNARFDAVRRASGWLEDRIEELRQQSSNADLQIQKFRSENNLLTTNGTLVSDQQLQQVNSQLVQAQADTAQAQAKYQQIKAIIDGHRTDSIVAQALDNSVINDLRTKYLDTAKRETELEAKLGPNHIQVLNLRAEMGQYDQLLFQELGRIAQGYQSDYQIAQARQVELGKNMQALEGVAAASNDAQVQLRQLQQQSDTYKTLYQNFLQRYQESIQQQSFPMNTARVITAATPPLLPSNPKKPLVLAVALVLGAMLGGGVGAMREVFDRAFRTGEQLREELDVEFLGLLPEISGAAPARRFRRDEGRPVLDVPPMMRYVLDKPISGYAETLRGVKVASDLTLADKLPKIIGVVSVLPGEGKSTTSKNLASLLASQGARTLLIDADIRHPGLTRSVAPTAPAGLIEVLLHDRPVGDVLLAEPGSNLVILPTVVRQGVSHTSEILSSLTMRNLLETLSPQFDYIIVDLPPLGPIVDARAMAPLLDTFLLVVEWGQTSRAFVRNTLTAAPVVRERLLGAVLNKVDVSKLKLYDEVASGGYYYAKYTKYYQQAA